MIYKYSRRTTPGDDELPLISDSVLTTRCELSKCSLQRDVNEVFLFHGTSVCGNPPQFCPTFDDSMTVCYPSASLGRYFAHDYRPRHRWALLPVDWFIWCRLLFFRSVQQSRPGYHTLARNMCTYGCHTWPKVCTHSFSDWQYGTPVPFEIVQELEGRCRRSRAATANQTPEQEKSKCIPNAKDATAKRLPLTKGEFMHLFIYLSILRISVVSVCMNVHAIDLLNSTLMIFSSASWIRTYF